MKAQLKMRKASSGVTCRAQTKVVFCSAARERRAFSVIPRERSGYAFRSRGGVSLPSQCLHRTFTSTQTRRSIVAYAGATENTEDFDYLLQEIGGTAIYLVGMMGSGKSTVGRQLAEKLSYRFFDTDDVIEKSLGATVSQIFEENGEDIFRDIETKVLQELSQYARSVISTGGGAVLSRENWGNMRHGIVVWLNGSPQTLASRIQGQEKENRPLLNDVEESQDELTTKLTGILDEREKFYNEADIVVLLEDADSGEVLSPESLTGTIMEKLAKAIQDKKKEVEEKKDFKIEGMPDSMQVREPYETTATNKTKDESAPKGFQKKKD